MQNLNVVIVLGDVIKKLDEQLTNVKSQLSQYEAEYMFSMSHTEKVKELNNTIHEKQKQLDGILQNYVSTKDYFNNTIDKIVKISNWKPIAEKLYYFEYDEIQFIDKDIADNEDGNEYFESPLLAYINGIEHLRISTFERG